MTKSSEINVINNGDDDGDEGHIISVLHQSLLIISPVTRCAATWPLKLELKLPTK